MLASTPDLSAISAHFTAHSQNLLVPPSPDPPQNPTILSEGSVRAFAHDAEVEEPFVLASHQ